MALPQITDIVEPVTSPGRYEKFELTFGVTTVATMPHWPYDTDPNGNITAEAGVSVDGLFLAPGETDWDNAIVQPAFVYQDYTALGTPADPDYLVPNGEPVWMLRFAPTAVGEWQYKIRAQDSEGTTTTDAGTFACVASAERGFVHVSATDVRYFEHDDGTYFHPLGTEVMEYDHPDGTRHEIAASDLAGLAAAFPEMKTNGLNVLRAWWNAAQWPPAVFGVRGYGYVNTHYALATTAVVMPGRLYSMTLSEPPFSNAWTYGRAYSDPCVKPETEYDVSVWINVQNYIAEAGEGVGIGIFGGSFTPILSELITADTDGWVQLTGTFMSAANPDGDDYHGKALIGVAWPGLAQGDADIYWTDLSLKEHSGVSAEYNLTPNYDPFAYVRQRECYFADQMLDLAKVSDVFLKICLMEKLDITYCCLQADGAAEVSDEAYSVQNFYGTPEHASRTYFEYFWRYCIARWGYATNILDFVATNEGDTDTNHYAMVQAMAAYFKANDPNQHMVTVSVGYGVPATELWANPLYPDLGYGDWHRHVGPMLDQLVIIRQHAAGWQDGDGAHAAVLVLSQEEYVSPPNSCYLHNAIQSNNRVYGFPIAITPGHSYTVTCRMKLLGITRTEINRIFGAYLRIEAVDKWYAGDDDAVYMAPANGIVGASDWTEYSVTFTPPASKSFLSFMPSLWGAAGEVWFDDITLHDNTDDVDIWVPNGGFDETSMDYDTALINPNSGAWFGKGSSRVYEAPICDSNVVLADYGDDRPDADAINYGLVADTEGIWYRKFLWSQLNPYGVISFWYNLSRNLAEDNAILACGKTLRDFMAGIPLNNGYYEDVAAVVSDGLRAYGQKDLVNNRAHLWIDNSGYTWRAVVGGTEPGPVSGVTIGGFESLAIYCVRLYDTSGSAAVSGALLIKLLAGGWDATQDGALVTVAAPVGLQDLVDTLVAAGWNENDLTTELWYDAERGWSVRVSCNWSAESQTFEDPNALANALALIMPITYGLDSETEQPDFHYGHITRHYYEPLCAEYSTNDGIRADVEACAGQSVDSLEISADHNTYYLRFLIPTASYLARCLEDGKITFNVPVTSDVAVKIDKASDLDAAYWETTERDAYLAMMIALGYDASVTDTGIKVVFTSTEAIAEATGTAFQAQAEIDMGREATLSEYSVANTVLTVYFDELPGGVEE